jgi:hypothetical protein
VEQIRRNLATKILVCMAASTKMRCLPPCTSISPLLPDSVVERAVVFRRSWAGWRVLPGRWLLPPW